MAESMSSSFESLSMPLPEEPVGVGARWESRARTTSNGMSMMSKQTVEVVSIQGSKVSLKITSEQSAPAQAIKNPMLPPDADVNLTQMVGKGTSTTTIDLATLAIDGTTSGSISMQMAMKMQGMEQTMAMTTNLKMTMATIK